MQKFLTLQVVKMLLPPVLGAIGGVAAATYTPYFEVFCRAGA